MYSRCCRLEEQVGICKAQVSGRDAQLDCLWKDVEKKDEKIASLEKRLHASLQQVMLNFI